MRLVQGAQLKNPSADEDLIEQDKWVVGEGTI